MPATTDLVVDQRLQLDYERLDRAIREAKGGQSQTFAQSLVLAEIRACRAQIAKPLDPTAIRGPNPNDRARISGLGEITLTLSTDTLTNSSPQSSQIRIGPDLVSVAFALSDELHINEFDAAVLLSDARLRAAVRPDRDVVAAAKELASVRRRNSIFYLQRIIRSALDTSNNSSDISFLTTLKRERDLIFADYSVFPNLITRIRTGWDAQNAHQTPSTINNRLRPGEFALLAETIFLLAYTVQLSRDEATMLRSLLKDSEQVYDTLLQQHRATSRSTRATGMMYDASLDDPTESEILPSALVEAESVRNLLLLSWMTALDRSRYQNMYDPRSGNEGVNMLLKDSVFIPLTSDLPKVESDEELKVPVPKAIAAAELTGAIFRLAVAEPNESDAVTAFLRHAAYDKALSFLTDCIASWIESRAGSLSVDADLYADVLEDLANDITEAPHVLTPIVQFVTTEIQHAAAATAYPSRESVSGLPLFSSSPFSTSGVPPTSAGRRTRPSLSSGMASSPGRAPTNPLLKGRPPLPPAGRNSERPYPGAEAGRRISDANRISFGHGVQFSAEEDAQTSTSESENVLASLTTFVARAITLAPSKLGNTPASGGLRYWSSVGPANWGFIQRIGDTLMDLWDVAMRNPHAPGGVGDAFREVLKGFLELLASTCQQDHPLHAVAALRFLSEGGHSVVSLEQLFRGLVHVRSKLGELSRDSDAHIDDTDFEVIYGIVNVIASAADALSIHGGIMTILGERGKELAINIASLASHSIQYALKDVMLKCLGSLDDHRAISKYLERAGKDKATRLRVYFQNNDARQGDYEVTNRILKLASLSTSWSDDDYPAGSVESIATWFGIEEVLSHWSRRKYVCEAHRWGVVHQVGSLIRDIVYRKGPNWRSQLLARLLTPAPGTGAASPAFKALVCACGLIRATDSSTVHLQEPSTANLFRLSGRASLTFAAEHGLGDSYRMMQEAVRTCSRVLSLLLESGPGQLSLPKISVVSASELLEGEIPSICAATTLVFHPDSYVYQIMRAGYSPSVCAAVLSMLARAARQSINITNIFAKDPGSVDQSATEFRTSLGLIVSRSNPFEFSKQADGTREHTIESKNSPDYNLMQGALSLVEYCLGTDGSSKPGLFILGLNLDTSSRYQCASYGVLGALVEMVADPNNGDDRFDGQSRAEAAMFLERLAANTVRSTSLAVLDHLRDVCASDDSVRGSGFADEMLFRVMEQLRALEPQVMTSVNWDALALLVSSCLSLSALNVRVFAENETNCSSVGSPGIFDQHAADTGGVPSVSELPSPLELLRVVYALANGGASQYTFECFFNWYLLLGARLSVHKMNRGYNLIPLLFEIAIILLESLSQPNASMNLGGLMKKDGGQAAARAVLVCIERIQACDAINFASGEDFISEAQCAALLTGIIKSLSEVNGVGSNSASTRAALYTAFIICANLAEKHTFTDIFGRAFGGKFGQSSGTEVIIGSACSDVVVGSNVGTKTTALAAMCLVVRLDSLRSIIALEAQNRMRKVVQVCLGEESAINRIVAACSRYELGVQEQMSERQAATAAADGCFGLLHAITESGHGARLLVEGGCVVAVSSLFNALLHLEAKDTMMHEGSIEIRPPVEVGLNLNNNGVGRFERHRRGMLNRSSGVLAASIACGGSSASNGLRLPFGTENGALPKLLGKLSMEGIEELETVSNVAVFVSRLPDDIIMDTRDGTNVCAELASLLGVLVPFEREGVEIGGSKSKLSAGASTKEILTIRESRRIGVLHPEGGSLFERDLVQMRALCARNVFAAVLSERRVLLYFAPILEENSTSRGANVPSKMSSSRRLDEDARSGGSLHDVLRICKVMVEETERAMNEQRRIDTKATAIVGGGNTKAIRDIAEYCAEEHGVEEAKLTPKIAASCLRDASIASKRHGCVCITVLESSLLVLRDYVVAAREVMRGHPMHSSGARGGQSDDGSPEKMSIAEADRLLRNGAKDLVSLCNYIEAMSEDVWLENSPSFSKQVCRQIRTACSDTRESNSLAILT